MGLEFLELEMQLNRIGQSTANQVLSILKLGHGQAIFTLWGNPLTSPCDPVPPFLLIWNLSPKDIELRM